jgi:AAA+ superfamily predicted ATPase
MTDTERLVSLLNAEYPCIRINTVEEDEARQLVASAFVSRGKPLWRWTASDGLCDGQLADSTPTPNTEHLAAACVFLRAQTWQPGAGVLFLDAAPNFTEPRTMRELRDLLESIEKARGHAIFVDSADLPELLRNLATPFDISLPDEPEIEHLVKELLRSRKEDLGLQIDITRHDFEIILRNLRGLTRRQVKQVILDVIIEDHRLNAGDLNHILASKRRCLAGADGLLEYIEAPTHIDDIGGMTNLKSWLARRQEALCDTATQFGLTPPRGLFLLGVQGAGKSLAAKAVATAWCRPLLRLDPSILFDRYIGESERRLNSALQQAEAMAPIVLWVDEIEKGFASAASQSVDGGLSKRMFGTLLTWMQERTAPVFFVATANDIESLPPELLRKGRFDEIFFVDLPTEEARAQIFRIHLSKRKRDPQEFDIAALVKATDGYSGSEIEQAIIAGLFDAFSAKTDLTTDILLKALKSSPPLSVTMAEKIDDLRAWSRGRCVPADITSTPQSSL